MCITKIRGSPGSDVAEHRRVNYLEDLARRFADPRLLRLGTLPIRGSPATIKAHALRAACSKSGASALQAGMMRGKTSAGSWARATLWHQGRIRGARRRAGWR